ncbi:MAG: AIR synthase-related protein, partial [Actinomycetota bacterium]
PLYLDEVRRLRATADVRGLAHITGGGILGNLSRVLPDGLRADLDWNRWERPPVFGWLARHVSEDELRRVFNLGIGYVAVVPDPGDGLVIGTIVRA